MCMNTKGDRIFLGKEQERRQRHTVEQQEESKCRLTKIFHEIKMTKGD